jgi:hypothetical protein
MAKLKFRTNYKGKISKEMDPIIRDIEHYFEFLDNIEYKIIDAVKYPKAFGNWKVVFESPYCIMEIYSDRNEINLIFSPIIDRNSRIEIRSMIFFLSQEQNFIGSYRGNLFWGKSKQYERLAKLLEEYINQITPFFGENFEKYKDDLFLAQKKYNHLLIEAYGK